MFDANGKIGTFYIQSKVRMADAPAFAIGSAHMLICRSFVVLLLQVHRAMERLDEDIPKAEGGAGGDAGAAGDQQQQQQR